MNDDKLPHLVEQVDEQLLRWTLDNKLTPDMMLAIVLARMTLVASETSAESHFLALLEKAKQKIFENVEKESHTGTLH
jgi:succinate dehydrogenase flavin-adding protein (antitoxin of CptAB toxin-antitoxin module)